MTPPVSPEESKVVRTYLQLLGAQAVIMLAGPLAVLITWLERPEVFSEFKRAVLAMPPEWQLGIAAGALVVAAWSCAVIGLPLLILLHADDLPRSARLVRPNAALLLPWWPAGSALAAAQIYALTDTRLQQALKRKTP